MSRCLRYPGWISHWTLSLSKWIIQKNAINGWRNVFSAERVMEYSRTAEQLQQQNYLINSKKYAFGLIDSLELQTAQIELVSTQKDLADNQIDYLKALVNLDNLTGMTLKTWNIQVQNYPSETFL